MAKTNLDNQYWVVKSNPLNEMRTNNLSLQELRLFSIYLSKINPLDTNTRLVRINISDFHAIMETETGIRHSYYEDIAKSLLGKTVKIPYHSGFKMFCLFHHVAFYLDEHDGQAYFEFNAHDDALPLLFDLKSHYFKYELWNALALKGKNQLRIYEILKQYEHRGFRIVAIPELKELLGIAQNEYQDFKFFKRDVLDPCQKALTEKTDITFTYEVHSKLKRKTNELKFNITKNKNFKNSIALEKFIDLKNLNNDPNIINVKPNLNDIDSDDAMFYREENIISEREEKLISLRDAVNREFTIKQMQVLYDILMRELPHLITNSANAWQECFRHFRAKYNYMHEVKERIGIDNTFGYMKSIIGISD